MFCLPATNNRHPPTHTHTLSLSLFLPPCKHCWPPGRREGAGGDGILSHPCALSPKRVGRWAGDRSGTAAFPSSIPGFSVHARVRAPSCYCCDDGWFLRICGEKQGEGCAPTSTCFVCTHVNTHIYACIHLMLLVSRLISASESPQLD